MSKRKKGNRGKVLTAIAAGLAGSIVLMGGGLWWAKNSSSCRLPGSPFGPMVMGVPVTPYTSGGPYTPYTTPYTTPAPPTSTTGTESTVTDEKIVKEKPVIAPK